jgi:hypothetical protein
MSLEILSFKDFRFGIMRFGRASVSYREKSIS